MIINYVGRNSLVMFQTVSVGTVFKLSESGDLCLRVFDKEIEEECGFYNAVSLRNNEILSISFDELVEVVDCELIVKATYDYEV